MSKVIEDLSTIWRNGSTKKKIACIGSINADMSIRVERFVAPGETMRGKGFKMFNGGKGANQAAAAGNLAGTVFMFGKIGNDPFAEKLRNALCAQGVFCDAVVAEKDISTGAAMIQVADSGQNAIIIDAGANALVDEAYIDASKILLSLCNIAMLQLEIPMATNIYAAKYCREQGMTVILDPAPAAFLPAELLESVDIITPNETELEQITGIKPASWNERLLACKALCDMGVGIVINKAGPDGVYVYREGVMKNYPTYEVEVVDTTAAGDSFNGAFAYAMSCGVEFEPAVDFANLLAAVSTTGFGAQSAMPTRLGMEKARAALHRKEEILP